MITEEELTSRLSGITTHWDLLIEAHKGLSDAQGVLLRRYCGAVYRYFEKALRNPDTACDLCQEFALRFLRGDFRRAEPQRGRFRDLLQKSLYHMVIDHYRRIKAVPQPLGDGSGCAPAVMPDESELDAAFVSRWQQELIERAWEALAVVQANGGHLFYDVLKWRSENQETPAARLAEKLSTELGRSFTEAGVRQILHRARVKFAELLMVEVAQSIDDATPEQIERELIALGLLPYCQPALDSMIRR